MHLAQTVYDFSPAFMQTILLNLYAGRLSYQRFGRRLEDALAFLRESARWSTEEIKAYQDFRFEKLIKHAYETVPYYREVMRSRKLIPSDFKTSDDLVKLPVIDKSIVKAQLRSFISSDYPTKKLFHGHTSGTTGSPLDVYWSKGMVIFNNACDWRQKEWAGINYGDRHAVLLGRVVVPVKVTSPPFWRMNYVHNQLWLSAFHMSEDNLPAYCRKLEDYAPKFIEGYPSTLYILANFLLRHNKRLPLEAVFTSAETLYQEHRVEIEAAFDCQVYDFYGSAERVTFASECKHHFKHLNSEYAITEVLDSQWQPVVDKHGKITGTTLHNFGMPLIRYQTNDISRIVPGKCDCGLEHPIIEAITTKCEDIVVTPDGRWISPSVLTHPFKSQKNILKSQIIQHSQSFFEIKIVPNQSFTLSDANALLADLTARLGGSVDIKITRQDDIPNEPSGKYRWVVSHVPKPGFQTPQVF